jgi:CheY-like chemotaxis protein
MAAVRKSISPVTDGIRRRMRRDPKTDGLMGSGTSPNTKRAGRILIVDDEVIVGNGVKRVLSNMNQDSVVVPGGHCALKEFEQRDIILTISDFDMPGMNGLEVMRRLREIQEDAIVVMHTATPDISDDELRNAGVNDVVRKVATAQQIKEAVERNLQRCIK